MWTSLSLSLDFDSEQNELGCELHCSKVIAPILGVGVDYGNEIMRDSDVEKKRNQTITSRGVENAMRIYPKDQPKAVRKDWYYCRSGAERKPFYICKTYCNVKVAAHTVFLPSAADLIVPSQLKSSQYQNSALDDLTGHFIVERLRMHFSTRNFQLQRKS